ncbi:hypothetical protein B0J13DRAFT_552514 [Dactylonectria estremocensis]|uniref:Uncharacterized protein n=1 Tax=Dactylonectria estremocensis TaxID=1079267 RepID=A0A9P9J817_9HYPO|nr:hypothetical protein B0J13DRAFT_552514 [Dactylonectria estremocensis]
MSVPIEADPGFSSESESGADSDFSSTSSITSSLFDRHYCQGRSYANPKYGRHWLRMTRSNSRPLTSCRVPPAV